MIVIHLEKVKSKREVVASERRLSVDNENSGSVDQQLWATSISRILISGRGGLDERYRAVGRWKIETLF